MLMCVEVIPLVILRWAWDGSVVLYFMSKPRCSPGSGLSPPDAWLPLSYADKDKDSASRHSFPSDIAPWSQLGFPCCPDGGV